MPATVIVVAPFAHMCVCVCVCAMCVCCAWVDDLPPFSFRPRLRIPSLLPVACAVSRTVCTTTFLARVGSSSSACVWMFRSAMMRCDRWACGRSLSPMSSVDPLRVCVCAHHPQDAGESVSKFIMTEVESSVFGAVRNDLIRFVRTPPPPLVRGVVTAPHNTHVVSAACVGIVRWRRPKSNQASRLLHPSLSRTSVSTPCSCHRTTGNQRCWSCDEQTQ